MAWLVTHMWMALTAAAVFALTLGWTLRGILVTGRMRRAVVEKDVALTELEQAREEIERLFAAQRAQKGEGGSVADTSARKIADLTSELQKAKTELASLKSAATKAPGPAADTEEDDHTPVIVRAPARAGTDAAPAAADPAGGEGDESPTLVWRNRHLESRVKHLEAQLAEAPAAAPAQEAVAPAAALPTADEEGIAKLKWQADYLKQRVESLEAELAKAPAAVPAVAEDVSEEMARLRWRNRFLEGRLAYFEGGAAEVAAETAAAMTGAEAMLGELEAEDAAADMTEAVEAMVEEVSAARTGGQAGEEPAEDVQEEAAAFADVADDEEESLAEADAADEDDVSAEAYSDEDLTADEAEDAGDEDEAFDKAEASDEEDPGDEADEDEAMLDEDGDGAEYDEYDEVSGEEDELTDEADEDDLDEDDEAYDEEEDGPDEEAYDEEEDEISDESADEDDFEEDEFDGDEDIGYEPGEELVAERPMAMKGPVEGHPDDLTLIGGIGPKIQVLLNELGIWHYDQIAAWTPENVAWIDEHLNFNGRITREGWVEQAAVLVGDAESV